MVIGLSLDCSLFLISGCPGTGAEGGRGWRLDVSLTAHPLDHMIDPNVGDDGRETEVETNCADPSPNYSRSSKKSPMHVIDNDEVMCDVRPTK